MEQQTLSQDEVDALLKGINEEDIETETAQIPEDSGDIIEYDFNNQGNVMRGRMPALEMIHDKYAVFVQSYFEEMFSRIIQVTPESTETMKYGSFINSLHVPTSLNIFSMSPLQGSAVMIIESKLVFTAIDILFGGNGKKLVKIEGREFTLIEQKVIKKLAIGLLKSLEKAWNPIHKIEARLTKSEINPQFANIVPHSVTVLVASFEVEIDEIKGKILLAMPYSSIEPIIDKLRAGFQGDQANSAGKRWSLFMKEALKEAKLNLSVELGRADITLNELLEFREGRVIPLNKFISDELVVKVEGDPKFMGYPGISRGNKAIQISSVVEGG